MVEAERPGSVLLSSAVDPVWDVVSPDRVDPDGLLVGAADLDGLGELTDSPRRISENRGKLGRLSRFERGDLLVAATRSNEPKAWLADRAGFCTTSLTVLRPNGRLDPLHLLWWFRARAARRATKRIELDKEWIELPAKRRDGESAVLLLDRLSTVVKLRRRTLARTRRLGPAMFQERLGDPLDKDGVWPTVRLGEMIAKLETGWSPKCADRPAREGEWGVIKVSAVSSGRFRAEENKALPHGVTPREELELEEGDLLMVRSNSRSLVGTTAIVTDDHPRLLLTDKVWRLRLAGDLNPRFLMALLSHASVRRRLSRMATGNIASMQNLTQPKVLDLRVALPPDGAQAEHVVDLTLLDFAEQAQLAQLEQLEQLLTAVLGIAFSSSEPDVLGEVVVKRALFHELSPLHQAIWRTLVGFDGGLTMLELSGRLGVHAIAPPGVDRLRRALHLLTAVGVATQVEDSNSYRWFEALPYELAGSS